MDNFCYKPGSGRSFAYMRARAATRSTLLHRECWVATGQENLMGWDRKTCPMDKPGKPANYREK